MKARSVVVVAVLLMWTAVPALHCLSSSHILTPQERACCQAMGNNCGEMQMETHSCCKKAGQASQAAVLVSSAFSFDFAPCAVATAYSFADPVLEPIRDVSATSSPPPSVTQSSVLRI
jgi:hypothetical protein